MKNTTYGIVHVSIHETAFLLIFTTNYYLLILRCDHWQNYRITTLNREQRWTVYTIQKWITPCHTLPSNRQETADIGSCS